MNMFRGTKKKENGEDKNVIIQQIKDARNDLNETLKITDNYFNEDLKKNLIEEYGKIYPDQKINEEDKSSFESIIKLFEKANAESSEAETKRDLAPRPTKVLPKNADTRSRTDAAADADPAAAAIANLKAILLGSEDGFLSVEIPPETSSAPSDKKEFPLEQITDTNVINLVNNYIKEERSGFKNIVDNFLTTNILKSGDIIENLTSDGIFETGGELNKKSDFYKQTEAKISEIINVITRTGDNYRSIDEFARDYGSYVANYYSKAKYSTAAQVIREFNKEREIAESKDKLIESIGEMKYNDREMKYNEAEINYEDEKVKESNKLEIIKRGLYTTGLSLQIIGDIINHIIIEKIKTMQGGARTRKRYRRRRRNGKSRRRRGRSGKSRRRRRHSRHRNKSRRRRH